MSGFSTAVLLVACGFLVMNLKRTDAFSLPETMDKAAETFDAQSLESNENEAWPQPQKRSTLLLDRLVYALQKAIKQDAAQHTDVEVQRTGPDRRVYWRCYFNAVSCFRRK